ncbi:hypothetical protein PRIPAC_96442, partial [Pristionchus pacificus]|uniref:Uncharacterized protein n=1 Tax=Pristionchus pacificus TaxID=54126 RepID=A0A2A6CUD7_PRIPA
TCPRCFGQASLNGEACTGAGGRCISQGAEIRDDRYNNDHFRPHVPVALPNGPRRDLPTARVVPFGAPVPSPRLHVNQIENARLSNGERPAIDDHGHPPISPPSPDASYCVPLVEPLGRHFYPSGPRSSQPPTRTGSSSSNPSSNSVDELRRLSVALDRLIEDIDRRWRQEPRREVTRRSEVEVRPPLPPLSLRRQPTLAEQLLWSSHRRSILSTTEEVLSSGSSPSTPPLSITPPSSSSPRDRPPVPPRTCSVLTRYRQPSRVVPRLFAALPSNQGLTGDPPSRFSSQSPGRGIAPPARSQPASSHNHQPPQVREPEYMRQLARIRTSRSQLGLVRLHPLARSAAPPPPPAPTANRRSFFRGQHRSDASEQEQETFL